MGKALAHNSPARGLHEGCKAIERGDAQLTVLAEDCNNADYKKLVEALCREHNIDAEGNPKKVVKCSMAVVKDYGEDSEGLTILIEPSRPTSKQRSGSSAPGGGAQPVR